MAVIRRMTLESGAVRHQEETPNGGWKFISKDRYDELRKAGATVRRTKASGQADKPADKPARSRNNKSKGESGGSRNRLLDDLFANMRY